MRAERAVLICTRGLWLGGKAARAEGARGPGEALGAITALGTPFLSQIHSPTSCELSVSKWLLLSFVLGGAWWPCRSSSEPLGCLSQFTRVCRERTAGVLSVPSSQPVQRVSAGSEPVVLQSWD